MLRLFIVLILCLGKSSGFNHFMGEVMKALTNRFIFSILVVCFLIPNLVFSQTVVWSEDFENNPDDRWSADQGVWEMEQPTSGPGEAHSGLSCAATVLSGVYPSTARSGLIRRSFFTVPSASENPRFRFWHWYSIGVLDWGQVQIKEEGSDEWIAISERYDNTGSGVWTCPYVDLSAYAGKKGPISFCFYG